MDEMIKLAQIGFGLQSGVLGATDNRMGVWTQGCSLPKCRGCTSIHTWNPALGHAWPITALLAAAKAQLCPPQGLTISGGEPSDQPLAVASLIRAFRALFPGAEVVLYSGLRWPVLAQRFPDLVALLDVAITGPYVRTLEATALTGSSNQEVVLLTPLAECLYRDWRTWPLHRLQVSAAADGEIVTVGIPDTRRMIQAVRSANISATTWDPSWEVP